MQIRYQTRLVVDRDMPWKYYMTYSRYYFSCLWNAKMDVYRGCNSKDIRQHFRLMLLISSTYMDTVSVKGEVEGGRN